MSIFIKAERYKMHIIRTQCCRVKKQDKEESNNRTKNETKPSTIICKIRGSTIILLNTSFVANAPFTIP